MKNSDKTHISASTSTVCKVKVWQTKLANVQEDILQTKTARESNIMVPTSKYWHVKLHRYEGESKVDELAHDESSVISTSEMIERGKYNNIIPLS